MVTGIKLEYHNIKRKNCGQFECHLQTTVHMGIHIYGYGTYIQIYIYTYTYIYIYTYIYVYICTRPCHPPPPLPPHGMGPIYWPHMRSSPPPLWCGGSVALSPSPPCGVVGVWYGMLGMYGVYGRSGMACLESMVCLVCMVGMVCMA